MGSEGRCATYMEDGSPSPARMVGMAFAWLREGEGSRVFSVNTGVFDGVAVVAAVTVDVSDADSEAERLSDGSTADCDGG